MPSHEIARRDPCAIAREGLEARAIIDKLGREVETRFLARLLARADRRDGEQRAQALLAL